MNHNTYGNFSETSPILPLLSVESVESRGYTTEGSKVTLHNNHMERTIQIDRLDGNCLAFIGLRRAWKLIGLVVVLEEPWEDQDDPTLAKASFTPDQVTAMKLSRDFSRIVRAIPMSSDEQALLRELVGSL